MLFRSLHVTKPSSIRRCAALLAMCGLAAGCTTMNDAVQGHVASRSPQIPENQIDQVDGLYKGTATTVTANSPLCPAERFGTVVIGDHTLNFAQTPSTIFITPVQPDGTLHTETPTSVLDGRLQAGRLVFTVKDQVCETRYDLRWVL